MRDYDDGPKSWVEIGFLLAVVLALAFVVTKCEDICMHRCEAQGHEETTCAMKCYR